MKKLISLIKENKINNSTFLAITLLIAIPIILIYPVSDNLLSELDYTGHRIVIDKDTIPPHFLYFYLVKATQFFAYNLITSQFVIMLINYVSLVIFIYLFFNVIKPGNWCIQKALLANSILVLHPVTLFAFYDYHAYFGYIPPNVYHNSTLLLLKPLAVLHFIWMEYFLLNHHTKNDNNVVLLAGGAFLAILLIFAKPSYTVILLPALGLFLLLGKIPCKRTILFIFLPSIIALLWFVSISFGESQAFIWAPFLVMANFSKLWLLFPKLLLSILFPLTLILFFRKRLLSDQLVTLSWLMFLVSVCYTYLLAESGTRMFHGNWTWSSQIAVFLLFVTHARAILRIYMETPGEKLLVLPSVIYALHLVAGVAWYLSQYLPSPSSYW